MWLFFTSDLIGIIKKSTSSDREWVCVGWLERFDWMWNKQGLPQYTAKAIKWSLWGGTSRLWWLCAGHESGFCIWSLVLSLCPSTSLICLSVCHCHYPPIFLLKKKNGHNFPEPKAVSWNCLFLSNSPDNQLTLMQTNGRQHILFGLFAYEMTQTVNNL